MYRSQLVEMDVKKTTELGILISVCVHCLLAQTFPYVSFNGQTLTNHSYVNLSLVGNDDSRSDSVRCHTDLSTCCSGAQGPHRGDWYFPDGTQLSFADGSDIYEVRLAQGVDLRRNANDKNGMYRCDIPTNAVHDESDTNVRDTVYVGLYYSQGKCHYRSRTSLLPLQVISQSKLLTLVCKTTMFLHSPSPVSPLVDLLPMSLGPETPPLSPKEL